MLRKFVVSALAVTDLLIGFGAFGHSFMGRAALDAGLAGMPLDAHTDRLIYLVWYFCGGCMLVFGMLVVWSAWRAWSGKNHTLVASGVIGVFYLLTGILALDYMREPFWSVFVILGGLATGCSVVLGALRTNAAQQSARVD